MKKFIFSSFIILIMTLLTACGPGNPNPTATIETSMGTIEVEIFQNEIPELSKNFMTLSKEGKYDGIPIHRVVKGFMIQTGDFTNKDGTGGYSYKGPGKDLKGEYDKRVSSNLRGTLSMANRGPDTNGSQFFINLSDNTFLDHDKEPLTSQHPVFGKVISGMQVVDDIGNAPVNGEKPKKEIQIKKITVNGQE